MSDMRTLSSLTNVVFTLSVPTWPSIQGGHALRPHCMVNADVIYSSNWPPRSEEPLQNDVDDDDAGNAAATDDVAIAVEDDAAPPAPTTMTGMDPWQLLRR